MLHHEVEPRHVFVAKISDGSPSPRGIFESVTRLEAGKRSYERVIGLPGIVVETTQLFIRFDNKEKSCPVIVCQVDCDVQIDLIGRPARTPIWPPSLFDHDS